MAVTEMPGLMSVVLGLSGLIATIIEANTAAWILAAVLLGSGLWVFAEAE